MSIPSADKYVYKMTNIGMQRAFFMRENCVTNGVSLNRKSGVTLSGVSGSGGGSSGAIADSAMNAVAGRVATALAKELRLTRDDRDNAQGGNANDPYAIDALAQELAAELGGGPADRGQLARALHAFAQESAALIGARPESGSVAAIQQAIADGQAGHASPSTIGSVADVIAMIDHASLRIAGG